MMSKEKQLILEITEAFKGVTLNTGIGLHEGNAIDGYEGKDIQAKYRLCDEKLNWEIISISDLNDNHCSLSYFDADGMRFHLPAFMIAEIKGEYYFDLSITLTHDIDDYRKKQFSLLSKNQKNVIAKFLTYLLELPDFKLFKNQIESAMQSYWLK